MKKRGVIWDVDGTLIREVSWQKLNLAMGVPPEVDQQLYEQYHAGAFSYQQWVDQLVAIYKANGPVHRSQIEEVLNTCTLLPGAREVSLELQRRYRVGIISGGLQAVVTRIARGIGVPEAYAFFNSRMIYDRKGYLKRAVTRGDDHKTKLADLHRLCCTWGIRPEECICIGDSHADLPLFQATGNGVTFAEDRCKMLHTHSWQQITQLADLLAFL